jgi:hypothetical protein
MILSNLVLMAFCRTGSANSLYHPMAQITRIRKIREIGEIRGHIHYSDRPCLFDRRLDDKAGG